MGWQAVPEVGALDQGVGLVGDQSPERDGQEVTSLLPYSVSWSEHGSSPGLQGQAEAVGLPIGQADHRDSLLGQHGVGHRGVATCKQKEKAFTYFQELMQRF